MNWSCRGTLAVALFLLGSETIVAADTSDREREELIASMPASRAALEMAVRAETKRGRRKKGRKKKQKPAESPHDYTIAMRLGGWFGRIDGDLQLTPAAENIVIPVSVEDDLDASKIKLAVTGEINLRFGLVSDVWISGYAYRLDESNEVNRQIRFGNTTFDVNGVVQTDFELENLKFQYGILFGDLDESGVHIGLVFGANYFHVRSVLTGTEASTQITASDGFDEQFPVPFVGLHAEVAIGDFVVMVDVSGLALTVNEYSGSFFDATLMVYYRPFRVAGFFAGYRIVRLDFRGEISDDDYDFDIALQGFVIGVEARF